MAYFTGPQHGHVVGATRASDTPCILDTRVRPTLTLPIVARRRDAFPFLVAAAVLAVVALYFARLGSVPPGPYLDEASIGYNAWTIAHFGVDQYGNHVPLFFVDFGDYKGPIATYLTVPFAWLWGTTLGAVRAPSVLAGIAVALVAGALAFRLTRSRVLAVVALLFTALQPWLFLQSHTMMEGNVLLLLCVVLACWFVAEAIARQHAERWWSAAGIALGAAVYAYSMGRLLTLLLALAVVATCYRFGRRAMLRFLFPIAIAYIVLLAATLANPQVLFARAQVVSLFSDHPTLFTAIGRFFSNYLSFFSPSFLVVSGDGNLRQTTGFGGVIVAATLPLMIAGLVRLGMRWREPYSRFILLGLLLSPIPAALTLVAPHALRGAGMFAFLTVLMIEGLAWARELIGSRHAVALALVALVGLSASPYFVDFFTAYPVRAAAAFDAGEAQAMHVAHQRAQAGNHWLFLSTSLDQPAIQLMWIESAPPPQDSFLTRAKVKVISTRPQLDAAQPGDVLALGPRDVPPAGSRLLFVLRGGAIVWGSSGAVSSDQLHVYVD